MKKKETVGQEANLGQFFAQSTRTFFQPLPIFHKVFNIDKPVEFFILIWHCMP